jgi:alcohol dehydrogenase (cytochrome c)/quinohemoprotein ethanol dehydrogenase
VSGGVLPDLRYSPTLATPQWFDIVLGGILKPEGMTSFAKEISRPGATAIRDYVIFRTNQSKLQVDHDAGKATGPDKR